MFNIFWTVINQLEFRLKKKSCIVVNCALNMLLTYFHRYLPLEYLPIVFDLLSHRMSKLHWSVNKMTLNNKVENRCSMFTFQCPKFIHCHLQCPTCTSKSWFLTFFSSNELTWSSINEINGDMTTTNRFLASDINGGSWKQSDFPEGTYVESGYKIPIWYDQV